MSMTAEQHAAQREVRIEQQMAHQAKRAERIAEIQVKVDRLNLLMGQSLRRNDRFGVMKLGLLRDQAEAELQHLKAQQR
jgi:hypothetical protein